MNHAGPACPADIIQSAPGKLRTEEAGRAVVRVPNEHSYLDVELEVEVVEVVELEVELS